MRSCYLTHTNKNKNKTCKICGFIGTWMLNQTFQNIVSKIAGRVLGPDHVTWTPRHCARCSSLNHFGTVPGVQAWTTSVLCQMFKWKYLFVKRIRTCLRHRTNSDVTWTSGTVPRWFKLEHLAQCRSGSSLNTWHSVV
jgi:hypothetical protein